MLKILRNSVMVTEFFTDDDNITRKYHSFEKKPKSKIAKIRKSVPSWQQRANAMPKCRVILKRLSKAEIANLIAEGRNSQGVHATIEETLEIDKLVEMFAHINLNDLNLEVAVIADKNVVPLTEMQVIANWRRNGTIELDFHFDGKKVKYIFTKVAWAKWCHEIILLMVQTQQIEKQEEEDEHNDSSFNNTDDDFPKIPKIECIANKIRCGVICIVQQRLSR